MMGKSIYFVHLDRFYLILQKNDTVKSVDVALYMAIIHVWNKSFFKNPIPLYKKKMLNLSRISHNTYGNSLKRLHEAGLIAYKKGRNDKIPALVTVIPLGQYEKAGLNQINQNFPGAAAVTDLGDRNASSGTAATLGLGPILNHLNSKQIIINNQFEKRNKEIVNLGEAIALNFGSAIETIPNEFPGYVGLVPTQDLARQYFLSKGYGTEHADAYFKYNEEIKWRGCKCNGDWKRYADQWMQKNEKYRIKTNEATPPEKSLQSLFDSFLKRKLRLNAINSNHFDLLQLKLTDEVKISTIRERLNLLEGSNNRVECLLIDAYRSEKFDDPEVLKDKEVFDDLAKKVAVWLYFQQLQKEGKTVVEG